MPDPRKVVVVTDFDPFVMLRVRQQALSHGFERRLYFVRLKPDDVPQQVRLFVHSRTPGLRPDPLPHWVMDPRNQLRMTVAEALVYFSGKTPSRGILDCTMPEGDK
jgi:hypothetical protein